MAMLSSVMPSAVGVLSSTALPAAFYGMKVFARSSSYLHLTAPNPGKQEDAAAKSSRSAACEWTFPPALRELTRAAGGFEGEKRWPLGPNNTLLDHHLSQATSSPSSCFVRHYSIMPRQQPLVSQAVTAAQAQQHTAALQLPAEVAQDSQLGVLSQWFAKTQPRMKGFSRKLALRQVNRKIIARVARRFTIGIPVLGLYFVSKLMVKDLSRVKAEYASGDYAVAALFSTALAADVLDLAAQFTVITGLAHANLGVGLASAAALLALADKASLATAALSFSCGLGGELMALKKQEDKQGYCKVADGAKSE